jgi:hypothetical protein
MNDDYWWPIRKTASIISVEYGYTHATLFATDVQVQEGPPFAIRVSLEKNLLARHTGTGTYLDAAELARGEIRRLKWVVLDDSHVIEGLSRILEQAEDIEAPWRLFLDLRGRHEFAVEPEFQRTGGHQSLILSVIGHSNGAKA